MVTELVRNLLDLPGVVLQLFTGGYAQPTTAPAAIATYPVVVTGTLIYPAIVAGTAVSGAYCAYRLCNSVLGDVESDDLSIVARKKPPRKLS